MTLNPTSDWPDDTTCAKVQMLINECSAIAQNAADAGYGDLVGIAEDAEIALKDLFQAIASTVRE